jgi:hypothetical protein
LRDPHPVGLTDEVTCRYVPKPTNATSPKFDCRLDSGDVIKVKYDTLEIQAETAGTRLLAALGMGTDHVSIVRRVRCLGCPASPFQTRRTFEYFFATGLLDWWLDPDRPRDFQWAGVERRIEGRAFEIGTFEGWQFGELDLVDPAKGGASRAEIDTLRLIAVILGHWDNKLDNQRLMCLGEEDNEGSAKPCASPLLVVHDVGSTFGTRRVDLPTWSAERVWTDPATCQLSLDHHFYGRGTFVPVRITEAGRLLAAKKLRQLSEAQLVALFQGARFPDPATGAIPGADPAPWARALLDKISQVADRAPCPPTTNN